MKPILLTILLLLVTWWESKLLGQATREDLPTDKHISQFIIEQWGEEEGLPSLTLNRVLQTKDGYLWISSFNGLYRFDGQSFQVFDKRIIKGLQTNTFLNLHETKDRSLLVGTASSGVFIYKDGKLRKLKDSFNKSVEAVYQEDNGNIWIGTRQDGMYQYLAEKDSIVAFTLCGSLSGKTVTAFAKGTNDELWIGVDGIGVIRFDGKNCNVLQQLQGLENLQVSSLHLDRAGILWIGTTKGLFFLKDGVVRMTEEVKNFPINFIYQDRAGSLWIATSEGIARKNAHSQQIELLTEANGLPNNFVMGITQDHEGSLWLSTYRAGLVRLRDGMFTSITPLHGVSSKTISGVTDYEEGKYIVATESGKLHLVDKLQASDFPLKTVLNNPRVKYLYRDTKNFLWLCTYTGLLRINPSNGEEVLFDTKNGLLDNRARIVYEDVNGNIWVGSRAGGVSQIVQGKVVKTFTKEQGLSSTFIMTITGDKNGTIYVGTNDAGIDVLYPDGTSRNYSTANGLPSKLIFTIRPDRKQENVFWIGTNLGIARLQHETFQFVNAEHGLSADVVFDILEDTVGNFWCSSSIGVFMVSKSSIEDFWSGKTTRITSKLYGTKDGMPEKECTGATLSFIARDYKMLFPTLGGVAILDPYRRLFNQMPPPVDIHTLIVDGQELDLQKSPLVLEAGTKRLIFRFSGLSYIAPQKVHFKYRLAGVDKTWVEAYSERQAVYTELSPGDYIFTVIAANNDGVWNEKGASLSFVLKPHFYQTHWFYLFCGLLVVGIGYAAYKWRIRQIEREKEILEKIIKERTAEISQQKEEIETQRDQLAAQSRKLELAYNDIKVVSEIGQEVTAILNLEDLVFTIYKHIKTLMLTDYFAIGSCQENSPHIDFDFVVEKDNKLPPFQVSLNDTYRFSVKCITNKQTILINSVDREEIQEYSFRNTQTQDKSQSVMYVPLVFKEKAVGVLTVQSYRENAYVEQHITILQAMASYISIALENAKNYGIIADKNEQIMDSIRYAKTIQQALLPSLEKIQKFFQEIFIIYKPKDIVSGDFYWVNTVEDELFVAVADCTGHGVPGAFMSMIGISMLNEIVNVKKIKMPHQILEVLAESIYHVLAQEEGRNKDGMDIALCKFSNEESGIHRLSFSGAKRGIWLWEKTKNHLLDIKGSAKTIGGIMSRKEKVFELHDFTLSNGDILYLQTDGFGDQCNPKREKLGTLAVKEHILQTITHPLLHQKASLLRLLESFQQNAGQRDDITFIGLKI